MVHHSRRSFLKAGVGVAVLGVVGRSAVLDSVSAQVLESASDKLMPFPLVNVRLGPGIFKEQEEINARYLDERNALQGMGSSGLRIARALQWRTFPVRGCTGFCRFGQC